MFLQKYLIGFKLRLWLGHSRTFTELCISHSCCVFRFIVLLEGKPSARLRFWMLWTGFLLRVSLYLGALSFSSTLMCSSVPAAEKQPHANSTLYFWDGTLQVMSRAGSLQTWCLELRFIRPDNIIYHSLRVLKVLFCKFQVSICLHWGEDWVWPHCHKAQIGGVLQWCLSFCRFLPSPHMIMELNYSDHQVLGHSSNQSPSPSIELMNDAFI